MAVTSNWQVIDDLSPKAWDEQLAAAGGYPLQSALWGAARARADGIESERLLVLRDERPVLLARVESRPHPLAGKIAWIPQGPQYLDEVSAFDAHRTLNAHLRSRGYQLCFENPYDREPPRYAEHGTAMGNSAMTSIVDLSIGSDAIWAKLSSNWRNNVRQAERKGVEVREVRDADSIAQFVAACERLSLTKGFRYQGSEALVSELLVASVTSSVVARLYCATLKGQLQGGLLVLIVGGTMQIIFSAAIRGTQSSSRLLSWVAMQAAAGQKVTRYDLGGIDPVANPGGYEFKRQLRGREVTIPAVRGSAFTLRGRAALAAAKVLGGF